jgi:hypothetical protein
VLHAGLLLLLLLVWLLDVWLHAGGATALEASKGVRHDRHA